MFQQIWICYFYKTLLIYKTQEILQLEAFYNLEVRKFIYKSNNSQLTSALNNYIKRITDVHQYKTKQTKTGHFDLSQERSNLSWNLTPFGFCCVHQNWSH